MVINLTHHDLLLRPIKPYQNSFQKFVIDMANAISVPPVRGSRTPALPPRFNTVDPTLEQARSTIVHDFLLRRPNADVFPFPARIQNAVTYAVKQYVTAMKNHATIHFERRVRKYIYFKGNINEA